MYSKYEPTMETRRDAQSSVTILLVASPTAKSHAGIKVGTVPSAPSASSSAPPAQRVQIAANVRASFQASETGEARTPRVAP